MLVELHPSLIAPSMPDLLDVLAICAHGATARHAIVPLERERWKEWAQGLGVPHLADELKLVWDEGERLKIEGIAREQIRVMRHPNRSNEFTPFRALTLLGYPLRVLLENGRTDRDFLLAFANRSLRKELRKAAEQGWLIFESAGGIDEILPRLNEVKEHQVERYRIYCLSDSDARELGAPSQKARRVQHAIRRLAKRAGLHEDRCGHVLRRRAAENYAPPEELVRRFVRKFEAAEAAEVIVAWNVAQKENRTTVSGGMGRGGSPRRQLLAALALKNAPIEAIACLDFSKGRGSSADDPRTSESVWTQLGTLSSKVLEHGFGKNTIRSFFQQSQSLPDSSGEIQQVISTLLGRV